MVGHTTLSSGDQIHTGVTAILPHSGNLYRLKVPAAISVFNGYGKLAGYTQVMELGNIETPIILTNTLSVGRAVEAVVKYTLGLEGNNRVRSVNAVVGETNDGTLNDIRGMHVTQEDVLDAITGAKGGLVAEGCVGAGTGTRAMGFKGGIGTSSRITNEIDDQIYTVGVLVQSNFGRSLRIKGVPVGEVLGREAIGDDTKGSCMIVIATNAPVSERNLERMANRAFIGMGRTTDYMSNGSGDYAIAFTTAWQIEHDYDLGTNPTPDMLSNTSMSILFRAVEEATEEAILNSLFMATTTVGNNGTVSEAIPIARVKQVLIDHKAIDK
jgi:D-aminopeptidase